MESHAEVYGASRNAVTAPDLTPDAARAEVEAFLGEGFSVWAGPQEDRDGNGFGVFSINVEFATGILCLFSASEVSYRAAVDAIKQAWRDAVRPWMEEAIEAKLDTADVDGYAPTDDVISRVLKESDHE
jgi:hypothetical protein